MNLRNKFENGCVLNETGQRIKLRSYEEMRKEDWKSGWRRHTRIISTCINCTMYIPYDLWTNMITDQCSLNLIRKQNRLILVEVYFEAVFSKAGKSREEVLWRLNCREEGFERRTPWASGTLGQPAATVAKLLKSISSKKLQPRLQLAEEYCLASRLYSYQLGCTLEGGGWQCKSTSKLGWIMAVGSMTVATEHHWEAK